jgi:hypothetical protein
MKIMNGVADTFMARTVRLRIFEHERMNAIKRKGRSVNIWQSRLSGVSDLIVLGGDTSADPLP